MNKQEQKKEIEKTIKNDEKRLAAMRQEVKKLDEKILRDKVRSQGGDIYEEAAIMAVNKALKMHGRKDRVTKLSKAKIDSDPVVATLSKYFRSNGGGGGGSYYSRYRFSYDDDGLWITHDSGDNYAGGSHSELIPNSLKAVKFIQRFKINEYPKYLIKEPNAPQVKTNKRSAPQQKTGPSKNATSL